MLTLSRVAARLAACRDVALALALCGAGEYELAAHATYSGAPVWPGPHAVNAALIPLMTLAYQGLERSEMPDASIFTRTAQQVGGSFGVAVLAVVVANVGFDEAFWWSIAFTAVAAGLSLLVPGRSSSPDRVPGPSAAAR